jgi:hypothetical protein
MNARLLAAALLALLPVPAAASSTPAATPMVPPFVEDYAKAVAEARARKVPLFIEAWAPW